MLRPSHALAGALQIAGLAAFAYALTADYALSWWAAAGLFYALYYGVGMSAGLHRYYAHRQFAARRWARAAMLFCATAGGQSAPAAWIHQHRLHHRGADTPGDPHWFAAHGWKMLLVWGYPRYGFSPWALRRYFRAEPMLLWLHRYHNAALAGWVAALALIGGVPAVLFAWAIPMAWTTFASLALVTAAHARLPGSYRNHRTRDASYNNPWLAVLTFGEGWHNNHHKNPRAPRFSSRAWEIDFGAVIVRLLRRRAG